MSVLYAVIIFLAGLFLGIRLLAGLYSVIDLWYTISTAWPVVLRRVLGWPGVTLVILLLLGGGWRWLFIAGMATHLLVYVVVTFAIVHTGARKMEPTPVVE